MEEKDIKNLELFLNNNSSNFLFDLLKEQEEEKRKVLMAFGKEEKKAVDVSAFNAITFLIEKLEKIKEGKYNLIEEDYKSEMDRVAEDVFGEGNNSV